LVTRTPLVSLGNRLAVLHGERLVVEGCGCQFTGERVRMTSSDVQ
jgi:hypothetical protein